LSLPPFFLTPPPPPPHSPNHPPPRLYLLMTFFAVGQTYEKISEQAQVLARIERARIIREVERSMSEEERKEPLTVSWGLAFPPHWLSQALFKHIFKDEAGWGAGVKYWTHHEHVIPKPEMARDMTGVYMVMDQGEDSEAKENAEKNAEKTREMWERYGRENKNINPEDASKDI
jgi:hypothetical protein